MRRTTACLSALALITLTITAGAQKRSRFKVLNYLNSVAGKKTIAGIHNREPNAKPAQWTNKIDSLTGNFPALWSGDFLFQRDNIDNRQIMIDEAVKQWKKGSVVNIMWHACNPALLEPCGWDKQGVLSKLTDQQWADLITPGTGINTNWRGMVDEVCIYLQQLKDKNIEVLWRPMHEMNQKVFWWGGRPGPQGTLKLYQMMHDYMTQKKKLTNLIWVWDIQDFKTLAEDAKAYNPGDKYWDIAALDIYDDKSGFSKEKYDVMVSVSKGKPIAIGECQKLPSAQQLNEQPKWTFFMTWSELTFEKNTESEIKAVYAAPNTIKLNQMPGWVK